MLRKDVQVFDEKYDIFLASQSIKLKLYGDLQFWLFLSNYKKNRLMDFITDVSISTDEK